MAHKKTRIHATYNGPYIVEGKASIQEKTIKKDPTSNAWTYAQGKQIRPKEKTTKLCRCGHSNKMPFCDESHVCHHFDGTCTAPHQPFAQGAQAVEGPNFTLLDNEMYCAFGRFCDAFGRVWNLVRQGKEKTDALAIQETLACPGGRLMIIDNQTGEIIEEPAQPEINILHDAALNCMGPLYAKGGIEVLDDHEKPYEVRARQALCRCGKSHNKPFCDGTHAIEIKETPNKSGLPKTST
ncbi:MAG: CDGSH iron-sulfur domain-containing protein [Alphaproteobacteria bacterium]|nr:CDGSH iron-sulfur domain-containing protein [Alphaproteobacteria bacterium]